MVLVRKHRAGSDSYGHTWVHDGDTVDMPYEQARELVAIGDGGFSIVEPTEQTEDPPRTEITETPPKRGPGRPPKNPPSEAAQR